MAADTDLVQPLLAGSGAVLLPVVRVSRCPRVPANPQSPPLHRLADFSTKLSAACREGRAPCACVCVCVCVHLCAIFGTDRILSALALTLEGFWVSSCLVWTLLLFFFFPPATIKRDSSAVATSYRNSQCSCLSSLYHNIQGCYRYTRKYNKPTHCSRC